MRYSRTALYFLFLVMPFLFILYVNADGQMMGQGMMRGMWQMMQWMMGRDITVDLSGPRPPENEQTLRWGKRIYEERCAVCHGEKGDGKGRRAHELETKPRDFTIGVFKFRSTPSGSLPTDEDIYTTISRGLRGTAMLPWLGLSKDEKWAVTYYIKTFSERFEEEEPEPPIRIPAIPSSQSALIERGARLYKEAKCWECHGERGDGDGPKAKELRNDWGHPVRPRSFTSEPFKRGRRTEDIFLTIATGLDGTPMSSYGESMSEEDIIALASYINSIAWTGPSGMMGMASMTPDERAGMMISHPAMPGMMGH